MPRTILLTGTAPSPTGVGGIILDDLCRFMPIGTLVVAYLPEGDGASSESMIGSGTLMRTLPTRYVRRPLSRFGRPGQAVATVAQSMRNRRAVRTRAADCVAMARTQGAEQVWAVLDAPITIELAVAVAAELAVPLRVLVWDDIEHNVRYFQLDRFTARRVRAHFVTAVRNSTACAVIGETMKEEYDRAYGTDAIIVRHGIEADLIRQPATTASVDGPIRIGFVGSVAARSAFQTFVQALDLQGWRLCGREVHLQLAGHRFDLWCQSPANIHYRGWRTLNECIALLSESDFNYLPQPFESGLQAFSRLSFPTKLTTYLAAGRPVLLHCPQSSSLQRFRGEHPFGVWVDSLDPAPLVGAMESLLTDRKLYANCVRAGQAALLQEFTATGFRLAFENFVSAFPEVGESG